MIGETVMEMEESDRFKEYLKGQITVHGDGLDMGAMNDFWFLACISDWRERPISHWVGKLGERPGNTERPRTHFGPAEFEVALAHTGGHVHCLNEAMRLKAVSCKAHSGNVPYHGPPPICCTYSNQRACCFLVFLFVMQSSSLPF